MITKTGLQLLPQYQDVTIEMVKKRRQHWYKVSGHDELLPSVTTCLNIIDKSGGLMGSAKKLMGEYLKQGLVEKEEDIRDSLDDIISEAKAHPEEGMGQVRR